MISIDEALKLIEQNSQRLDPVAKPLAHALHQVLADDIASDIDSPPHDKALMDGYAVRAADVIAPSVELAIIESITAGEVPTRPIVAGTATRIMTGSPLPDGADAVVVIENTTTKGNVVTVTCDSDARPEQNLLRRGTCIQKNHTVVRAGERLNAGKIGLLAEVGADPLSIYPAPRVSILVTGNELVAAHKALTPGKIRNSNGPMLAGLAAQDHAQVEVLGIGRDDPDELRRLTEQGLEADVLILSGGVSAGDLDLVPSTLQSCGVSEVFHKVRVKPGKPVWFGVRDRTLVFGLPGNPVSSFVCYLLFARAGILALQGLANDHHTQSARITHTFQNPGNRPVYYPAARESSASAEMGVTLLPWKGSADLCTLAQADCLAQLPPSSNFEVGDSIEIMRL